MSGPPRKPTKLRIAEGRRLIHKGNEPQPAIGIPGRPDWLSCEASAEWERVVPELLGQGVIALIDRAALSGLCQNWGVFVETAKVLNTVTDWSDADTRKVIMTSNDAFRNYMKACTEFGLTPASRCRIDVKGVEKKDKLAAFIKGAKTG